MFKEDNEAEKKGTNLMLALYSYFSCYFSNNNKCSV